MNVKSLLQSARRIAWLPVAGWLCAYKLLYWGVVLSIIWASQDFDAEKFYTVNARWPRTWKPVFASHIAAWDSAHYLRLSEAGYAAGVPSCAFYPLWPLLVRWISPMTGGSHLVSGMVLANLLSFGAWLVFYNIVRERWGSNTARWSLVFLIVFPGSLFFQFMYSESLFLLLVMGLWYGLQHRSYGVATLSAAFLPLTRAVGIFSLLPIGWHVMSVAPPSWLRLARDRLKWLKYITPDIDGCDATSGNDSDGGVHGLRSWKVHRSVHPLLLLGGPLLGWSAYLACMWHWTGNPFEGFIAQKYWGVHSIGNLWDVPKFVVGFLTPTQWHGFRGSLLDRCVFVLLAYCLPLIWKMDKGLFVWAWVLGVIPAMSGTFTSFTRYASCAFPMFIALAVFLSRREQWRLKWALLVVFVVLHIILVWRFVNFRWAG